MLSAAPTARIASHASSAYRILFFYSFHASRDRPIARFGFSPANPFDCPPWQGSLGDGKGGCLGLLTRG